MERATRATCSSRLSRCRACCPHTCSSRWAAPPRCRCGGGCWWAGVGGRGVRRGAHARSHTCVTLHTVPLPPPFPRQSMMKKLEGKFGAQSWGERAPGSPPPPAPPRILMPPQLPPPFSLCSFSHAAPCVRCSPSPLPHCCCRLLTYPMLHCANSSPARPTQSITRPPTLSPAAAA